jgi:hypothetical protein
MRSNSAFRLALLLAVGALYLASCASPAVELTDVPRAHDFGEILPDPELGRYRGFAALALGFATPWYIPWSANVFFFSGWILLLLKKNSGAFAVVTVAALLGFSVWALREPAQELHRLNPLVGYYLWQAALIVFALGAQLLWLRDWRTVKPGSSHTPGVMNATR